MVRRPRNSACFARARDLAEVGREDDVDDMAQALTSNLIVSLRAGERVAMASGFARFVRKIKGAAYTDLQNAVR